MKSNLKAIFTVFTLSFSVVAQASLVGDLLNSKGPLGDISRQIMSAHSSSGQMGGVSKRMSENDCYEQLDDIYTSWFSKINSGEIYSALYSHEKISAKNIKGEYDFNSKPTKKYFYGLTTGEGLKVNSYSTETAVHLTSTCGDYINVLHSEVRSVEMNYPIWKKGKRSGEFNTEVKECRVSVLSLGNLEYDVIACIGDNSIYTRFNK